MHSRVSAKALTIMQTSDPTTSASCAGSAPASAPNFMITSGHGLGPAEA